MRCQRSRIGCLAATMIAATLVVGCSSDVSSDAESVGTAKQAVTDNFSWSQGQPATNTGWSKSNGFCFLTGIAGKFRGFGEQVELWTDSSDIWQLSGTSAQVDVRATAACVAWSDFNHGYFTNNWHMFSTWVTTTAATNGTTQFALGRSGAGSFCYLGGISGEFNGGGEGAHMYQAANDGDWYMQIAAHSGAGVKAKAICVDIPYGNFWNSDPKVYSQENPTGTTDHAGADSQWSFLALNGIYGRLQGGGERAESWHIWSAGVWVARVASMQSYGGVTGVFVEGRPAVP